MIINNVNKKSFVQESVLEHKNDINKIEEEKKPEIELTNIGEENDEDFSKLIENTKNMDLGIKIETKKCKINIKKLLIELVFFIFNSISFLFYYLISFHIFKFRRMLFKTNRMYTFIINNVFGKNSYFWNISSYNDMCTIISYYF